MIKNRLFAIQAMLPGLASRPYQIVEAGNHESLMAEDASLINCQSRGLSLAV